MLRKAPPVKIFKNRAQIYRHKKDKFFIVDIEDVAFFRQYAWYFNTHNRPTTKVYPGAKHKSAHRLLMGAKPGEVVDHIDGNILNNRKSNLRICTHQQNCRNRRPFLKDRKLMSGVGFCKRTKKYRSYITLNRKIKFIGRFERLEDAEAATIEARNKHFGEFSPHLSRPK